jgi:hypothetical protein
MTACIRCEKDLTELPDDRPVQTVLTADAGLCPTCQAVLKVGD